MIHRLSTAAALAAALVLTLGNTSAAHAKNVNSQLKVIPSDVQVLVGINVQRLKRSPAFAELKKSGEFKKNLEQMKARGFHPERDVTRMLVGMVGKDADKGIVLIADGTFNVRKLTAEFRKDKTGKSGTHRGVTYYEIDDDQSVVFLGKRFAMTQTSRIKGLIDLYKGRGTGANSAMRALVRKTNTNLDFWLVASVPALGGAPGFGPGKDDLRTLSGSLDVQKGLKVAIDMVFKSAAAAQSTMQQLGVLKAMGNDQSLKSMGLDVVINKLKMVQQAGTIKMSLDLTPAEAKKLKNLASMF